MVRLRISVFAVWFYGVLAAAQISRPAVLLSESQGPSGLTLFNVGALISAIEFAGSALGFFVGLAIGRHRPRTFISAGFAIIAISIAFGSGDAAFATLLFLRTLEGFGYLLVVTAAPTLIVQIATDRRRPAALALWSTFVPVGLACGSTITAALYAEFGAYVANLAFAVGCAAAFASTVFLPSGNGSGVAVRSQMPERPSYFLAGAFGIYTLTYTGLVLLFPTFQVGELGIHPSDAGYFVGLATLLFIPGSISTILAARNGSLKPNFGIWLVCISLLVMALASAALFSSSIRPPAATLLVHICFLTVIAASSFLPPIAYARLPALCGADYPSDPRIASSNGLMTQFGAAGALIGPPLGGLLVDLSGWAGFGVITAIMILFCAVMFVLAERLHRLRR